MESLRHSTIFTEVEQGLTVYIYITQLTGCVGIAVSKYNFTNDEVAGV